MGFFPSEDQVAMQDAVQRYTSEACSSGARRAAFENESGVDTDFLKGLFELGAGGILIPADYGGLELGLIDAALASEIMGANAAPGPFLGHQVCAFAISQYGSRTQKEKWLPQLATGEAIGTLAFHESITSCRPAEWSVSPEGGRIRGGLKRFVPYPELAQVMLIGLSDGRLGLIDIGKADIEIRSLNVSDRTRRVADVVFNDTEVEILAQAGSCAAQDVHGAMLVLLAADSFGGASHLLHTTVDYVKQRKQFGRTIAEFQGVRHQLANLACEVEPSRAMFWYAALAHDNGQSDRARIASMANAHLADRFMEAARVATQLHGGIGFTWEFDLQIWFKRAMFNFAYGGVPSALRQYR